ncbi:MAG: hypothetical protein Q4D06_00690 [Coriobacteriia bacterium]|nr:hypothetical protein [Coriobacteriia bacterium]
MSRWNARRRQVKLKGVTPEEFLNQSLAAQSLFYPSKIRGAVQTRRPLAFLLLLVNR